MFVSHPCLPPVFSLCFHAVLHRFSKRKGQFYFYHKKTGESRWDYSGKDAEKGEKGVRKGKGGDGKGDGKGDSKGGRPRYVAPTPLVLIDRGKKYHNYVFTLEK